MAKYGDISRHEYKYKINPASIPELRSYVQPYTELDPYLKQLKGSRYTVRSIYFDTPELDYYYEKLDGLKVRKKLRVRTYNDSSEFAFLEIKRRFIDSIAKERSRLPFAHIERLISTTEHASYEFSTKDRSEQVVGGKFLYNLLKKGLVPIVLIVYEREAYIGKEDDRTRVTFDTNVRAQAKPEMDDILNNDDLVTVTPGWDILEIKFDDRMPGWAKRLVKEFELRRESISKYCMGVDACSHILFNGLSV